MGIQKPIEQRYYHQVQGLNNVITGAQQQIHKSRDINLSQIHQTHLQAQRQLSQVQGISTGLYERAHQQSMMQYSDQIGQLRNQYQDHEMDLLGAFQEEHTKMFMGMQKELQEYSDLFEELARTARDIQYTAFDYLKQTNIPGFEGLTQDDLLREGFYKLEQTDDGIQTVLTDKGRELWHSIFYGNMGENSFAEHLRTEAPRLWEQYIEDPMLFQRAISGFDDPMISLIPTNELFEDSDVRRELIGKLEDEGFSYWDIVRRDSLNFSDVGDIIDGSLVHNQGIDKSLTDMVKDMENYVILDLNINPFKRDSYIYIDGKLYPLEKDEVRVFENLTKHRTSKLRQVIESSVEMTWNRLKKLFTK